MVGWFLLRKLEDDCIKKVEFCTPPFIILGVVYTEGTNYYWLYLGNLDVAFRFLKASRQVWIYVNYQKDNQYIIEL